MGPTDPPEGASPPETASTSIGRYPFPRQYGPPEAALVVLLHGGPGAPGGLAPVARALADSWRVLEWAEPARLP